VSADNGLRAHLIVSDGVHIDTTDISAGHQATSSTPFQRTRRIGARFVRHIWTAGCQKSFEGFRSQWCVALRSVQFRLFRYANAGNGPNDSNKYIEYSTPPTHYLLFTRALDLDKNIGYSKH